LCSLTQKTPGCFSGKSIQNNKSSLRQHKHEFLCYHFLALASCPKENNGKKCTDAKKEDLPQVLVFHLKPCDFLNHFLSPLSEKLTIPTIFTIRGRFSGTLSPPIQFVPELIVKNHRRAVNVGRKNRFLRSLPSWPTHPGPLKHPFLGSTRPPKAQGNLNA